MQIRLGAFPCTSNETVAIKMDMSLSIQQNMWAAVAVGTTCRSCCFSILVLTQPTLEHLVSSSLNLTFLWFEQMGKTYYRLDREHHPRWDEKT